MNKKETKLYPNGSNEGKPSSAYVNLLHRSKVVDLSRQQLDKAANADMGKTLKDDYKAKGTARRGAEIDHTDFEFEQLCNEADPDLHFSSSRSRKKDDILDNVFSEQLAKVLLG